MDSQEWDRRYAGAELVWTAAPNRFVVAELTDLPPGRALDLGAGEGRNAVWLAARGWQVTAVDFSTVGLDKGRCLAEARAVAVDWVRADVCDYQPEAQSFQLVLVAYLQLRAAELDGVLRRAATALTPGGVLLVVGHDVTNLTEGAGARRILLSSIHPSPSPAPSQDSPCCARSESAVPWAALAPTARSTAVTR